MTTAAAIDEVDPRAVEARPLVVRVFSSTAIWVLLLDVLLLIVFGVISGGLIWTSRALESMLLSSTQGLLLALGLAMLMGAGFFDLSLGANLVLSSVVAAIVITSIAGQPDEARQYDNLGLAIAAGVIAALLTGTLFGLVNGWLIAYVGVNSLIATLATTGIGLGLALIISGGSDIVGVPVPLQRSFGQASLFDIIPLPTVVAIAAALILSFVLRFTRYGIATLAIGSSMNAADNAGIRVKLHVLSLAALAGVLAGAAGFIDISRYGSTAIQGHNLDGLAAVTAVVIGGTLLTGGRVSILGAVAGVMLAVILQTGLVVIGVQSFYQTIAIGVVLLVAVALDRYRQRDLSS